MSLLKKLIANGTIVHFADYRKGATLDEVNSVVGTKTNAKLIKNGVSTDNNGLTSYGNVGGLATLANMSIMISGVFAKVAAGQYLRPISKRDGTFNHFDLAIDSTVINIGDGVGSYSCSTANLSAVRQIAITYAANSQIKFFKNGLLDLTMAAATTMVPKTSALTVGGSEIAANNYKTYTLHYTLVANRVLAETEISVLTEELNQIPDQRPSSRAIAKGSGSGQIYFKGELGAIASETATTSGHLENSGCKVLNGSFKMTTEKNNNRIEKVIVCISTGSLYVTQAVAALTGWRRYVNTGAGYVAVVTDLATARTIPLNTGDKLIWASENHSRSLYQMA